MASTQASEGQDPPLSTSEPESKVLIYVVRRDLRVADNPILHEVATNPDHGFTHMLPLYVFDANHYMLDGFLEMEEEEELEILEESEEAEDLTDTSPLYPIPMAKHTPFFRVGHHRAKFVAQSVWCMKTSLEQLGSGLAIRVGMVPHVVRDILDGFLLDGYKVGAVWISTECGSEEREDVRILAGLCNRSHVDFREWPDAGDLIEEQKRPIGSLDQLPDTFAEYREMCEPLREKPSPSLPVPKASSLPPFPPAQPQSLPWIIPDNYDDLESALVDGLVNNIMPSLRGEIPMFLCRPLDTSSLPIEEHIVHGGERSGHQRLRDLLSAEHADFIAEYGNTRNQLMGPNNTSRLSAYLAQGCITARMIHEALVKYEDGTDDSMAAATGYGKGENRGSRAYRLELLWRDFMYLNERKHREAMYDIQGIRGSLGHDVVYHRASENLVATTTAGKDLAEAKPQESQEPQESKESKESKESQQKKQPQKPRKWRSFDLTKPGGFNRAGDEIIRWIVGMTGLGLIDASQRELIHTGFTSNRARMISADFLSKQLKIPWTCGAEWYEFMLVDYDPALCWGNWQYSAGVGNDPRGAERTFNIIKQSFDYDCEGKFVRTWLPELAGLTELEHLFQASTAPYDVLVSAGLEEHIMATYPVLKVSFTARPKRKARAESKKEEHGAGRSDGSWPGGSHGPRGSIEQHNPGGRLRIRPPRNWIPDTFPTQNEGNTRLRIRPPRDWIPDTFPTQEGDTQLRIRPPRDWIPDTFPAQRLRIRPPRDWTPDTIPAHGNTRLRIRPPRDWTPDTFPTHGTTRLRIRPPRDCTPDTFPAHGTTRLRIRPPRDWIPDTLSAQEEYPQPQGPQMDYRQPPYIPQLYMGGQQEGPEASEAGQQHPTEYQQHASQPSSAPNYQPWTIQDSLCCWVTEAPGEYLTSEYFLESEELEEYEEYEEYEESEEAEESEESQASQTSPEPQAPEASQATQTSESTS